METSVAHDVFIHVRIVMGTVVGLGITRLLMGTAGIIQHPQRARLSLVHLLWVLSIMLELILFWWWEYELAEIKSWTFGTFAFLIGYSVVLFGLTALLFPDNLDDYGGYEDFFLKRRKWFFGLFGATFILDIVDTLIKGEPYLDSLGVWYLMQVPLGIALCIIAIRTTDRRYHLALVLIHLAYQVLWGAILFDERI
ncbi:MAG: hypothetical protein JWQ89_2217 [Devosia sp.]|uniref:hypothetical protein n=1 Tax=Devosia sp. TaxID=1871048 RepID=UPI0026385684|nr:hypothetical protein [Devosia sp.]MDB5540490.1 hypothetical protein [Devosia sp.]